MPAKWTKSWRSLKNAKFVRDYSNALADQGNYTGKKETYTNKMHLFNHKNMRAFNLHKWVENCFFMFKYYQNKNDVKTNLEMQFNFYLKVSIIYKI